MVTKKASIARWIGGPRRDERDDRAGVEVGLFKWSPSWVGERRTGHAVPGTGARPVAGDEGWLVNYGFVRIGNGVAVTQSDQTAAPALARIRK
jgi:hypothetical protein